MEMDKLSTGEKVSAVSAVLLFVFMFFDWFGVEVSGVRASRARCHGGGSAWDALDVIPIFLMLAIVAAIGVAVIRLTDADLEPPVSLNTIVAVLGALAVLLILYRIVYPPGLRLLRRGHRRCDAQVRHLPRPGRGSWNRLRRLQRDA